MKKIFAIILGSSMLLTSCYTTQTSGNPAAVSAGASIGGMLGSIIGDRAGGFHGSQFGALVGTVAGAAIGNAATTPQSSSSSSSDDGYYNVDRTAQRRNYTQQYSTPVTNVEVVNIRFIDDNRNHCIDAEEECKLVFEVVNNGSTPAYNVTPIVEETSGLKHLTISPSTQIGYMPAGNRVRYTATLRADRRIKTSQADLRVYVTESNGGVSEVHEFSLPTQRK